MNFARFSVLRPVLVTMRVLALVLLGAICLTMLPVDLLPNVTLPVISVSTTWPNVAPEEIEAQVTRPVERAVSSVPGVYEVSSTSEEGSSSVRVQFMWGTDIGEAAVDVLQRVERAKRQFPDDPTLQTPIVSKFDPSQMPIITYGVSGEPDPVKLRMLLDNEVGPIIEAADGVASVTVSGGEQRTMLVEIDPDRLRAHNVSLADVTRRIAQENLNLPAGIARQSDTEYTVRSLGWFTSPKEVEQVPLGSFNGTLITLGDVARVSDSHSETRVFNRLNEAPAASMRISKQSGANTVSTAKAVFERVEQAKRYYPNLEFRIAYDQSRFIRQSIGDVQKHAVIGGVLAVLILLFFLRNLRSTLVVGLSIPISITSTFGLVYMAGFTLNTMSLGGLALATGLIVDDAVVVLENIFRHIERDKKDAVEASVSGATEIVTAVLASTFTVMIVFLPLLLVKGQAGQMFAQFALVVVFAMAVSLLDATTLVPMLASRLIHGEAHGEMIANGHRGRLRDRLFVTFGRWFDALDTAYRGGLAWALGHRAWVILIAGVTTAATLLLAPYVGTEMMPETDTGDLSISVRMPVGTALDKTDAVMKQVEQITLANPSVETVFTITGSGSSYSSTRSVSNQGTATVKLKEDRKVSTLDVIGALRKEYGRIPGVRVQIRSTDLVSRIVTGGGQSVEVDIFGNDLRTLSGLGRDVMDRLREVPGLENLDVNWEEATPELQWRVDRPKAVQLGVTFQDVANAIGTATKGTVASYYQEEGFQYPILVQLTQSRRKRVEDLLNIPIAPTMGRTGSDGATRYVTLRQVATPVYAIGPSQITRLNRRRYIAVTGSPQGRPQGEIQADVTKALGDLSMPQGYYWDWGQAQRRQSEEFGGMRLAVILAICLIYMLLASQFESLVHPLTILACVPLSAIGVALALFLTGRAFGLTAFIGLLMLVGIVVKNGILLVDYTNVLRGRGMERNEAVLTAGPTRLRPILMTTCASIFGMLPIAIGMGRGTEMQAPMATAVIGGLITSTLLTLLVVPTVYTLFDDVGQFISRKRGGAKPYSTTTGGPKGDGSRELVETLSTVGEP